MFSRDVEVVHAALRAGVDVDAYHTESRFTAMHSYGGSPNLIELLIQFGGDVNVNDGNGRPPLFWDNASTYLLLVNGAEPVYEENGRWLEKQRAIDKFREQRDTVLVLLLSIDGLSKGVALRVVRWVLQTH